MLDESHSLEKFKKKVEGKKVALVGFGVSNRPLAKYLVGFGADVSVFDKVDKAELGEIVNILEKLGVKFYTGDGYLNNLQGFDLIFRSPGIRYDIHEFNKAVSLGAELTSEMEMFLDLCPAKVIAVTGSDGKTTTATLIYRMLLKEGKKCWLGGNIGRPLLCRIGDIAPEDFVVLELSSFQLHTIKKSPNVAVITNISPNHLDIHKSMEEYVNAKKNIFRYQRSEDKLILNMDNSITRSFAEQANSKVMFFSIKEEVPKGTYLDNNGKIKYKNGEREIKIMDRDDIKIPGMHNVENYLAAISAVIEYVKPQNIQSVAKAFLGVEHRIELVGEFSKVKFYNDSIGTSPTRTRATLKAFNQKVILIAGGYDKKISYNLMGDIINEKVKCLILMGDTADKIEQAYVEYAEKHGIDNLIPIFCAFSMEDAVSKAFSLSKPGDIVILSPASASFDMYKNFAERGKHFKEIVKQLSKQSGTFK